MIFRPFYENMLTRSPGRALWSSLFLASFLVGGCATTEVEAPRSIPVDHFAEIKTEPIPLVMNGRVQDWINYFQGPGRERFERYLSRSGRYIPMIKGILAEYRLPEDLVYLAMIESGFNPHAYSRARATGTWQFIYRTGIRYGLKVNDWVDERRDPEKSTVAAAQYLKDLYDRFNNWYLAAAGYNAGEGKIDRAIRRYRTEDFWEMSKYRYLRRETKNYVPKMIAAALISKNPKAYGFEDVEYESPIRYDKVTIDSPTDLRVIAQCADVSYEEIKKLNPELKRWITPPHYPDYQLKIPAGRARRFMARYAELTPAERIAEKVYIVEGGGTYRQIAVRHKVSANFLAAVNQGSPDQRLSRGMPVLIPMSPPKGERIREFADASPVGRWTGEGALAYRVQKGDSLWRISRRLGVSQQSLKELNPHIAWGHLRYGRTIQIVLNDSASPKREVLRDSLPQTIARNSPAESDGLYVTHTVRDGDTLWQISQKYNVSVQQIKQLNGIRNHHKIRPGRALKIRPVEPPQVATDEV